MNNTESKKLHTLMQNIYQRREIALSNPSLYFPIIAGEFAYQLVINSLFEGLHQEVASIGKQHLAPFIEAKESTLQEFEATIRLLDSYKDVVPVLSDIIMQYEDIKKSCPQKSHQIIFDTQLLLRWACEFITLDKTQDHSQILEKLVKRGNRGEIIEYIFAPTLSKWHQEFEIYKRSAQVALYRSWFHIIKLDLYHDLRALPNRINAFVQDNYLAVAQQLHLEAQNFDMVLKEQKPERAAALGFSIEEYEIRLHRVWNFINHWLSMNKIKKPTKSKVDKKIINKNFDYIYSEKSGKRQGIFTDNGAVKDELEGMYTSLFYLLLKRKNPMSKDVIAAKLADPTSNTKPGDQIRNAKKSLHNALKKYFGVDVIFASKKGIWSINPLVRPYITLKR